MAEYLDGRTMLRKKQYHARVKRIANCVYGNKGGTRMSDSGGEPRESEPTAPGSFIRNFINNVKTSFGKGDSLGALSFEYLTRRKMESCRVCGLCAIG